MTDKQKEAAVFGIPLMVEFELSEAEIKAFKDAKTPVAEIKLRTEDINIKPMRVGYHDRAARYLFADEQVQFTALALGRDVKWVESLTPKSYAAVVQAVQGANEESFFACFGQRVGLHAAMRVAQEQAAKEAGR